MAVPTVVLTSPATAATGVATRATIQITFSEAVDKTTIKDGVLVLTDLDSFDTVPLTFSFSVSDTIVTALPKNELRSSITYSFTIAGASDNLPAGSVESAATGDALASTYTFNFQTGTERFVSLEEVTDRTDIDHVAPIREESELSLVTGNVTVVATSPDGFSTNNKSIDTIVIQFSEALDQALWNDNYFSLTVDPILDLTDYLGNFDESGDPKLYMEDNTVPVATPTGTLSVSGTQLTWTRDTSIPAGEHSKYNTFPFNAEINISLSSLIQGTSGNTLDQQVKIVWTTELYPMLSGCRTLRLDVGPVLDDFFDDTLNRIVLKRSIESWELNQKEFALSSPLIVARHFTRWGSVLDSLEVVSAKLDLLRGTSKELGDFRVDFSNRGFTKDTGRFATARAKADKAEMILRQSTTSLRPRTARVGANAQSGQVVFRGVRNWDSFLLGTQGTAPISNNASHRTISKLIDMGAKGHTTFAAPGPVYFGSGSYNNGYVYLHKT